MKRLFFILLFAVSCAHAENASYGGHGMILFGGKDGLYASHLPMFHAPHDYQVVLQLHLADQVLDTALRERLDGKSALWTMDPEKFELDRFAPGSAHPLHSFTADLVFGHFEQGGKTEFSHAAVVVDKVLLFRQLNPQVHASATAHYLPVGRFLVKQIDSRPDFDHIVALNRAAPSPVDLPKRGLQDPTPALAKSAPVLGTIYYSIEDLR